MEKEEVAKELVFCLSLWEKQGFCEFGNMTKCEDCGSPYLLWKLLTGQVLDKSKVQKRLTLEDWKQMVNALNSPRETRS